MGEILVKHGEKKEIAKLFEVSHVTVRDALKDRTKSDLSRRIRKTATDRGGKETL